MPRPSTAIKYESLAAGLAVGAIVAQQAVAQVTPAYSARQSDLGKAARVTRELATAGRLVFATDFFNLLPEIKNPRTRSAPIWVF